MVGNIFINYRRGDDPGFTQALYGRLEQAFAPERLFMDIDNIAPGLDFVAVLNEQVARCDVLIAVIGQDWLSASDETGQRRLDNPDDFVRIEIESALSQKKRVIPVLVNDAKMPRAADLPPPLRPFVRCNAVRLTHERFRADVSGLIKSLEQVLAEAAAARQAEGEASRRDAKAKAKAEAERLRQERQARKRNEAKTEAMRSDTPSRGAWQRFREWVAAFPPNDSWLIPAGLFGILLLVWRLPVLFYWLYLQGSGPLATLYALSTFVSLLGLAAVVAGAYVRRDSLTGPGLALVWFGVSSFLSLALLSVLVAGSMSGAGADLLPHGLALVAAVILIILRGRHLTGLEAAVYGIGLALLGNASVANSLSGTGGAAGAQLVVASLIAGASLAIVLWRRSRASGPEFAVYGLGSTYLLTMALLANLQA